LLVVDVLLWKIGERSTRKQLVSVLHQLVWISDDAKCFCPLISSLFGDVVGPCCARSFGSPDAQGIYVTALAWVFTYAVHLSHYFLSLLLLSAKDV
jgi:hypothetical protein